MFVLFTVQWDITEKNSSFLAFFVITIQWEPENTGMKVTGQCFLLCVAQGFVFYKLKKIKIK